MIPDEQQIMLALQKLYKDMELRYNRVARMLGFTCEGCDDNCCDSYFQHYTYLEWWYLWQGLSALADNERGNIIQKAKNYVQKAAEALSMGERPQIMCPLNRDGLCCLYEHRLLICRNHGVPASMSRPDGKKLSFPGCHRCQQIAGDSPPQVDRTAMLSQMVMLETQFLGGRGKRYPRIKLTIAEMIVKGPPRL